MRAAWSCCCLNNDCFNPRRARAAWNFDLSRCLFSFESALDALKHTSESVFVSRIEGTAAGIDHSGHDSPTLGDLALPVPYPKMSNPPPARAATERELSQLAAATCFNPCRLELLLPQQRLFQSAPRA